MVSQVDTHQEYLEVTRVEVIDDIGRSYSCANAEFVEVSFQDGGRTLKVFLRFGEE